MTENETEAPALVYANTHSFSHDMSHCDPVKKTDKCYSCKRYAAHLQVHYNQEKFRDSLFSYFSNPQKSCIEKNYQHFISINEK